ncbi:hydroxymyristoyl-ACP dehydratase [Marinihelvus fidelis]|uniref:Hydroxymyristoyl-ACP dehydratase n=1 Tax=Marinihelvus fidelis TaxID=2613842 RepID=A0A5N0T9J0_9GAMM|nr:hydroxymyristoyl-ACP dehydratase [Marinihelvus fidelis]KAA9131398.1 hydroxymyristoyl-ACP dehydratase [Marinihelvus fidelis]
MTDSTRTVNPLWPLGDGWPIVCGAEPGGADDVVLALRVDPGNTWFEGHFPGNPVLPGVVQLHWAVAFARAAWPVLGGAPRVDNLKFRQPVLPGSELTLRLQRVGGAGAVAVRFGFDGPDGPCSSGKVGFS